MKEENEWIHYTKLEFNDPKFNVFSIDTRDFHAGYRYEEKPHKDFETIKKYKDFFHTEDEVKDLLNRYFEESGGNYRWRFFSLEGFENWSLKYIRIWRTKLGFVICDTNHYALRKSILSRDVNNDLLK